MTDKAKRDKSHANPYQASFLSLPNSGVCRELQNRASKSSMDVLLGPQISLATGSILISQSLFASPGGASFLTSSSRVLPAAETEVDRP